MKEERNKLIQEVFPELRRYCQQRELEFEVVDMRWGVRDSATADHLTSLLCLNEIDRCRKMSQGPYFVVIISEIKPILFLPCYIISQVCLSLSSWGISVAHIFFFFFFFGGGDGRVGDILGKCRYSSKVLILHPRKYLPNRWEFQYCKKTVLFRLGGHTARSWGELRLCKKDPWSHLDQTHTQQHE